VVEGHAEQQTPESDDWYYVCRSVGVLLYVLLTGCSPFGGDTKQETFCNISQCKLDFPEDLFEDVSEDAKDLMRKLMVKEPR
jgi:serine/threonine protein kinase